MRLCKKEMAYIHPLKTKRKLLKQQKIIVFKQKKYYRMQRESLMVVQHH